MTREILVYGNRKQDTLYLDASTPDLKQQAFRVLFTLLDQEWEVYVDVADEANRPQSSSCDHRCRIHAARSKQEEESTTLAQRRWDQQRALYLKAREGDDAALQKLLNLRRHYEYEEWSLAVLMDPHQEDRHHAPR